MQEPHALVQEPKLQPAILAGGDVAQIDFRRLHPELWWLQSAAGQLVQELIQAPLAVGMPCGLPGSQGQVGPTEAPQKPFQSPLMEQVAGLGPVLLAGQGQLVEAAARSAGWEYEWSVEPLAADRDRSASVRLAVQRTAVVPAEGGLSRVETGTTAA